MVRYDWLPEVSTLIELVDTAKAEFLTSYYYIVVFPSALHILANMYTGTCKCYLSSQRPAAHWAC